jgi:hypothetical protein
MSVVVRPVDGLDSAADASARVALLDQMRQSVPVCDGAESVAAHVMRDMRYAEAERWAVVECGYSDGSLLDGPLEFWAPRAAPSANAPQRGRESLLSMGDRTVREGVGNRRNQDAASDILHGLVVDQFRRRKCMVCHIVVIAIPNPHQPVVDLLAPLAAMRKSGDGSQAVGMGVSSGDDATQLISKVMSTPSFRMAAAKATVAIHVIPDVRAAAFESESVALFPFDVMPACGVSLVLCAERHHQHAVPVLFEGARPTFQRHARSAAPFGDTLLANVSAELAANRATTIVRVARGTSGDPLQIGPLVSRLAAKPTARSPAQQHEDDGAAQTGRAWKRGGDSQRTAFARRERTAAADLAAVEVLRAEVHSLSAALQRRVEELHVGRQLVSSRRARDVHSPPRQSVDVTLRKVLGDNVELRRMLREILHDVDKVSDSLRANAVAVEGMRKQGSGMAADTAAAVNRTDRASTRSAELQAKQAACREELDGVQRRQKLLQQACRRAEDAVESEAQGAVAAVSHADAARVEAFARETASVLEKLRDAASAASENAASKFAQQERAARSRVEDASRSADAAEEELAKHRADVARLGSQLASVGETAQRIAAEAAEAKRRAEQAASTAERVQETRRQVSAKRSTIETTRAQVEGFEGRIEQAQRAANEAVDALTHATRVADQCGAIGRRLEHTAAGDGHEYLAAQERMARSEIVAECAMTFAGTARTFFSDMKRVAAIDGSDSLLEQHCRTCFLLQRDAAMLKDSERAAAADEARMRAELQATEREMLAMADAHAEELRGLQNAVEAATQRVASLRQDAASRAAEARRAAAAEEEVVDSLTEELVRQLHPETNAAIKRLDSRLGIPHDDGPVSNGGDDALSSLIGERGDADGASVADLYLQWCEAIDEARSAEQRSHAARQSLSRAEHSLEQATEALAQDRQLASQLEAALRDIEGRLAETEAAGDAADLSEMQQRHNIEVSIRALHEQGQSQCGTVEREMAAADAAITSLKAQLNDLRREANSLVEDMSTAGEPVATMEHQLTELRRSNDLMAAQLHLHDSQQTLKRAATADAIGTPAAAAAPPPAETSSREHTRAEFSDFSPYVRTSASTIAPERYGDTPSKVERAAAVSKAQSILESRNLY